MKNLIGKDWYNSPFIYTTTLHKLQKHCKAIYLPHHYDIRNQKTDKENTEKYASTENHEEKKTYQ